MHGSKAEEGGQDQAHHAQSVQKMVFEGIPKQHMHILRLDDPEAVGERIVLQSRQTAP